jgi:hypothetical protein
MTLNASGPISLGGPTTGQSINLELGNAATAVASINSTPFRTLANVPSGAITLSNFYGKSAGTYWALTANVTTLRRGFAASVNGILCVGSGVSGGVSAAQSIYFFNADGTFKKATKVNHFYGSDSLVYVMSTTNNNNTSEPIFYAVVEQNFARDRGFAPLNSTTNINQFSSNTWRSIASQSGTVYTDDSLQGVTVDSSSNVYIVPKTPLFTQGKDEQRRTAFASVTSSGTGRYTRATPTGYNANAQFQYGNFAALRSDNVLVVVGVGNSTTLGLYTVNTSTGAQITTRQYTNGSTNVGFAQVLIDSSNNIYVVRPFTNSWPLIYKLDSSYAIVAAKYYTPTTGGSPQAGWWSSGAIYNNTIYLLTTTSVTFALSIVAVNSSTLAPIWSLQVAFSNMSQITSEFQGQGMSAIRVTSVGIYIRSVIVKNSVSNTCILKLPLDGNISGAKTITLSDASTCTATFTYSTSSWNAADTSFSSSSNPTVTLADFNFDGGSGQTPATASTPTTSVSTF